MFHSARLKLTAWYLFIILLISGSFSLFVYRAVSTELERRFAFVEVRLQRGGFRIPVSGPNPYFFEEIEESKKNLALILIYTNGAILILSAAAGYFLAGRTLRPIAQNVERQKRFVADASHELRTPLTALRTILEVNLRSKETDRRARAILQDSLGEVDRLQYLTGRLLDLSRYQEGATLDFCEVDLAEVIRSSIKHIKLVAEEKNLDLQSDLQEIKVKGDEEELGKMVGVFLDNAVKYTPIGGWVKVALVPEGKWAKLKIVDSGMGIDEKDLPHIFDRFYRADASRSKDGKDGFGLGLSLAREIVEAHHGQIGVKSVKGEGTTFTIELPIYF